MIDELDTIAFHDQRVSIIFVLAMARRDSPLDFVIFDKDDNVLPVMNVLTDACRRYVLLEVVFVHDSTPAYTIVSALAVVKHNIMHTIVATLPAVDVVAKKSTILPAKVRRTDIGVERSQSGWLDLKPGVGIASNIDGRRIVAANRVEVGKRLVSLFVRVTS